MRANRSFTSADVLSVGSGSRSKTSGPLAMSFSSARSRSSCRGASSRRTSVRTSVLRASPAAAGAWAVNAAPINSKEAIMAFSPIIEPPGPPIVLVFPADNYSGDCPDFRGADGVAPRAGVFAAKMGLSPCAAQRQTVF